jgi:hypothetical protein
MARIAVILCTFLAACDVGDASVVGHNQTDGGVKMDGAGGGGGGDGGNGCVPNNANAGQTHHHAGENCMVAGGCHGAQPGAGGAFTFSGTLYTAKGGTSPMAGVTVRIKSSDGSTIQATAVTEAGGTFHSTTPITFPAVTDVTSCPTVTPMVSKLATGNGGCTGCHASGGTTSTLGLQ